MTVSLSASGRWQTVASSACCGQRRGLRRLPRLTLYQRAGISLGANVIRLPVTDAIREFASIRFRDDSSLQFGEGYRSPSQFGDVQLESPTFEVFPNLRDVLIQSLRTIQTQRQFWATVKSERLCKSKTACLNTATSKQKNRCPYK